MRWIYTFLAFSLNLLLFISCGTNEENIISSPTKVSPTLDPHSYSKIQHARTTHLHLDLDVNFDNKTIYGVARHTIEHNSADSIIFDIKELDIHRVTIGHQKEVETDYVIGEFDSLLGSPLLVKIDSATTQVNIYYQTTNKTEAIDWLSPELTSGKSYPFLYTQGQAILTRSWIPCQDTPSNRITYSADVKVPKELLALMSAENPVEKNAAGTYHFEMKQAIPAYLIALAVGNIEYRKLGKNCGVYAEPELIEQSAYEFIDLPKMITAAESLYGPYRWEQYDVLLLPYSFPYGGMENPRLTFANPTLLAGDRSLVSVIAHELAHSWSGNLVTNSTWDDFWMNEGFTVYFENRIMEKLYGKDVSDILQVIEYQELLNTLDLYKDQPEQTHLKLHLKGENPDDGLTDIAYVKGAMFLRTIEKKVGRRNFDVFLKNYFDHHSFTTLSTEDFLSYMKDNLKNYEKIDIDPQQWIESWVYAEGVPSSCIPPKSKRLSNFEKLSVDFLENPKSKKLNKIKLEDKTTQEWQAFIRNLPKQTNPDKLKELDSLFGFKSCGNAEIMFEWYMLGIRSQYKEIRPDMQRFLVKVGRRKFLEPIYTELAKNPGDKIWAELVFEQAKGNYHYVSRSTIEEILN